MADAVRAGARLTGALRQALVRLVRAVLRRPRLKSLLRRVLARLPALQGRLQGLMYRAAMAPRERPPTRPQPEDALSPRTQRMLDELKRARRERPR